MKRFARRDRFHMHVVVSVDGGSGHRGTQSQLVAHEPRAQFVWAFDSRARQLRADSLVAESLTNLIEADWRPTSQQNQILPFRRALHAKHGHVRKDLMKSR